MNYFELFDIPICLKVDVNTIQKKFYSLSRKYHPDFFSNASEAEQLEALEMSSMLNKAFKLFSKTDTTLQYVLQLKGLLSDDEKYNLPPDFLLEVMELNEKLVDAKMDDDTKQLLAITEEIEQLKKSIYEPVAKVIEHYTEATSSEKELLQVKDYYFKKKYLDRILESLRT